MDRDQTWFTETRPAGRGSVRAVPAGALDRTVHSPGRGPGHAQGSCGDTVTVVAGDTLARIAARCGTTVQAILAANPTIENPNLIFVGQAIEIPGG
ncbi:MAG: LysM domain-containing protein, partial [Anaerolineae bacterium]